MSATPALRMPIGVVVERRKAQSAWIDFTWRSVAALPGAPDTAPWTPLDEEGDSKRFYAGAVDVELFKSETTNYRDNLASGSPALWVALRLTGSDPPYDLFIVTADPAEGEALTEAGNDLVDRVPMPDVVRAALEAFVAEHHVEREFFKRKRNRADPEALARRVRVR